MTEQRCRDQLYYKGEKYLLFDEYPFELGKYLMAPIFDPMKKMEPWLYASTACESGRIIKYICQNATIILNELLITTKNPLPINNVEPLFNPLQIPNTNDVETWFPYHYQNLNIKTDFSGKIIIIRTDTWSSYDRMAYWSNPEYRTKPFKKPLVGLDIKNGKIRNTIDNPKYGEFIPASI